MKYSFRNLIYYSLSTLKNIEASAKSKWDFFPKFEET